MPLFTRHHAAVDRLFTPYAAPAGLLIHDALVIARLLAPQLVTTEMFHVDVALEGALTRGSSRRWRPDSLRLTVGMPAPQGKPVRVMQQVDNARLLALIGATLARG